MVDWHQYQYTVLIRSIRIQGGQREKGFTYFGVLLVVVSMGVALASAGEVWHTMQQR